MAFGKKTSATCGPTDMGGPVNKAPAAAKPFAKSAVKPAGSSKKPLAAKKPFRRSKF